MQTRAIWEVHGAGFASGASGLVLSFRGELPGNGNGIWERCREGGRRGCPSLGSGTAFDRQRIYRTQAKDFSLVRWFRQVEESRSLRRFGGGAISMNSNEPGDTLFNAAAIRAIFGSMLGRIFDPRKTSEIFRCAGFCRY